MDFKPIFEKVKIWSDFPPHPLELNFLTFLFLIILEGFPKTALLYNA